MNKCARSLDLIWPCVNSEMSTGTPGSLLGGVAPGKILVLGPGPSSIEGRNDTKHEYKFHDC